MAIGYTPPSGQRQAVYNRSIRTNNDCEGWHRHLPFYQLVEFLHQEALVTLQAQLVTDDKLKRDQRSRFKKQQGKISVGQIPSKRT